MEYLRSVKIKIEVDTNKKTYVLEKDVDSLTDLVDEVVDFVHELPL